jgi:hypothetical protein
MKLVRYGDPGRERTYRGPPDRGLTFDFFTPLLGWVAFHLITPEHSHRALFGRNLHLSRLSVYDVLRNARLREDRFRETDPSGGR